MKAATYTLPRADNLLDQMGECTHFATVDLAAGYWQIWVHEQLQEKTAFITPQGLYEFKVMPIGLTNAPSVFQQLINKVLHGLNPEDGPDFVNFYVDDIVTFSRTLDDDLSHLRAVLRKIKESELKVRLSKCSRHDRGFAHDFRFSGSFFNQRCPVVGNS